LCACSEECAQRMRDMPNSAAITGTFPRRTCCPRATQRARRTRAHTHFRDDPQDIRGELTSDAAKRSRSVALTSVLVIRDAQLYERSPPPLFEPIFTPSGTMDINVSRQLLMESPYRGARNCQHGGRICRYRQAAWHLHKSGHSDTEEPMHAHCLDESITL
jgi:hypothetical protein